MNTSSGWPYNVLKNSSTNCRVTWDEKLATQLPGFLLGALTVIAQLTNLIVFKFWRNPDPYVFFHISVAISSLLAGISLLSGNFLRYQNFTPLVIWLTKLLGVVLPYFADCSALFAIFCISIDRWLSVEYPAKYRSHVSRQKILFVIIVPIWTGSILVVSAGMIRYWGDLSIAPCSYRKLFVPQGAAYTVWNFVKGPIVLPFLFISQLRILIIGSSLKLRLWRGRAISASIAFQVRPQAGVLPSRGASRARANHTTFRIVWDLMLASMAVVIITLAINCPFLIFAWVERSNVSGTGRAFVYLSLVQHCYSPLVYVALFPQYRAVLMQASRSLRRHISDHWSIDASAEPTHQARPSSRPDVLSHSVQSYPGRASTQS